MNEHRETPKYSFSEKTDATSMSSKVYFVSDNTSHTVVDPTPLVPLHESNNTRILLYDEDTADRILSMTTTDTEERTKPFLQRVQLIGPGRKAPRDPSLKLHGHFGWNPTCGFRLAPVRAA
jgi:hypothetical protein